MKTVHFNNVLQIMHAALNIWIEIVLSKENAIILHENFLIKQDDDEKIFLLKNADTVMRIWIKFGILFNGDNVMQPHIELAGKIAENWD